MATRRQLSSHEIDFILNLQNPYIRDQIIKSPTKDDIRIIRNLCANLCSGNFKFNHKQRKKITPYAKIFRKIGNPKHKNVKKDIAQSGEALGIFAPLLVFLIAEVSKILLKKAVPV
jgi:hypothetical protein